MQRKELTSLPAASADAAPREDQAELPVAPAVMFVDDKWKGESLRLKELAKNTVWEIPFSLLLHAPACNRAGAPLTRLSMSLSKYVETSTARSAIAKALCNEHGQAFVASRLIFLKMTTKPSAAAAFLPVTLTDIGDSPVGAELTADGAVPLFVFPPAEVQTLLKPSTSSTSALPKDFARSSGKWELTPLPYTKEGPAAWTRISDDGKKTRPPARKARTQLIDSTADPSPPPIAPPPTALVPVAAPEALSPPEAPAEAPPKRPRLAEPAAKLPCAVDGGALEEFSESVTKTFFIRAELTQRKSLPIVIPAGVTARVTVELRA